MDTMCCPKNSLIEILSLNMNAFNQHHIVMEHRKVVNKFLYRDKFFHKIFKNFE